MVIKSKTSASSKLKYKMTNLDKWNAYLLVWVYCVCWQW